MTESDCFLRKEESYILITEVLSLSTNVDHSTDLEVGSEQCRVLLLTNVDQSWSGDGPRLFLRDPPGQSEGKIELRK